VFTCQCFFTGKPQNGFPINIVKLYGQNHKFCMIPLHY
jgi:hypothetical protein